MTYNQIIELLKANANEDNVAGMARFGINSKGTLGISVKHLREIAKVIGKNQETAERLWDSEIHEARILAIIISKHEDLTLLQMEKWVEDFDSWDICDQACMGLFRKYPFAMDVAFTWIEREEEFIRRAGFVIIASLAIHDKKNGDAEFLRSLGFIEKYATDSRNFVKKSVNWSLRQIGKRSMFLNNESIKLYEKLLVSGNKTAKWIANNALKELMNPKMIGGKRVKNDNI